MRSIHRGLISTGAVALATLCASGAALADNALRVDFTLAQASGDRLDLGQTPPNDYLGPAPDAGLATSGYLLLTFDDSADLMTDGVSLTVAPSYTASLVLNGAHASDSTPEQYGSLYQLATTYGLSQELIHTWSEAGVDHTDDYNFSFTADTGAAPLMGLPSAFAYFAAQQTATGTDGHLYLNQDTSSAAGMFRNTYDFNATITNVAVVPEPASAMLMLEGALALAGVMALRRRARSGA